MHISELPSVFLFTFLPVPHLNLLPLTVTLGYHPGWSTLVLSTAVLSTPSSFTGVLSTQLKQCNGY